MAFLRLSAGLAGALSLLASPCWADDPPSPLIGRTATVSGAAQYHSPGGEWANALVNEPVAAGVALRSATDGSVAIHVATARLAISGATQIELLRLDREAIEIGVTQGRIGIHLGAKPAATIEVDLPGGGAWLAAPGDYDIYAGDGQIPARIATIAGNAALGGGLTDANRVAASADAFDTLWLGPEEAAENAAVISPRFTGAALLAINGDWEDDDTYGHVWFPKDPPTGWAPYRYGEWRYLPPWGWTWIDAADWGFAPSHYGAWARIGDRWGWVPPPHDAYPVFSPAVVAFLGTSGIGLSRPGNDGAAVGWFPLAPGETVEGGSGSAEPHFRDRRAASVVPRAVFAGGQQVQTALLDLPEWRLDDAPVILGSLGIPPVGDGGSGYVAETVAPPVLAARVVSVPLLSNAPVPAPRPTLRQAVLGRIHEVLARATLKSAPKRASPPALAAARRTRPTAIIVMRPPRLPHPAAVVVVRPEHPSHNRRHLAAARGGAQLR